jgi:hypothetical protein
MRSTTIGLAVIAAFFATGCALTGPPITLTGSPADLELMVGEWDGRYTGGPGGRSGTIVFTLAAGEDHAHGDVLMIPQGAERGYYRYPGHEPTESSSQILSISFVSAAGGTVRGSLDRYWDPEAKCAAFATFHGTLRQDVMEGTFTTSCDGRLHSGGRWRVTRRR